MHDHRYPHLANNKFSLSTCFLCYLVGVATGIAVFIWLAQPNLNHLDELDKLQYSRLYE